MPNLLSLFFGFNGRVNRQHYWIGLAVVWTAMPTVLVVCALGLIAALASGKPVDAGPALVLGFTGILGLQALLSLLANICTMALVAKRLHDVGGSGLWCLVLLLAPSPLAGYSIYNAMRLGGSVAPPFAPGNILLLFIALIIVAVIVLGCLPGQPHANRWGAGPGNAPPMPQEPSKAPATRAAELAESMIPPAPAAPRMPPRPATETSAASVSFGRRPARDIP